MELWGNPSNGCQNTDGKVFCSPIKQMSLFKSLEWKPRNIQQSTLVYCAVLYWSSVLCLVYQIFPHYVKNGTKLVTKFIEHKMPFCFLYSFRPKHFSFQEVQNEIWSQTWKGIHVKYQIFLWAFIKLGFCLEILKNFQIQYFTKFRQVWTELFHTDWQTWRS